MAVKIRVQPIANASECPFYVKDTKDRQFCFVKQNISAGQAMAVTEENPEFDTLEWNTDCGGKFANCGVLSLLYDFTATPEITEPEPELEMVPVDTGILTYNPFEEDEDEDEKNVQALPPQIEGQKPVEVEKETKNDPPVDPQDYVNVRVQAVANVYNVKVDALVYPTNQLLVIDDDELNFRTHGKVQAELEQQAPPIQLGSVYPSSNGGNHQGGIVAKRLYHAVVSTQSRLVNQTAINKAVIKSLTMADKDGCEVVAMLPMDCGTFDLYQTAMAQLGAIYQFLQTVPTKSLRYVFIITSKDDQVTLKAFNEFFDRTFGVD